MKFVLTLALTLTLSPGEREQPLCVSGFANDCPANHVAVFSVRRRTILPLRGERAGVRESVNIFNAKPPSRPDAESRSEGWKLAGDNVPGEREKDLTS